MHRIHAAVLDRPASVFIACVLAREISHGLGLCGIGCPQVNSAVLASCGTYPILQLSTGMAIVPTSPPYPVPTTRHRTSLLVQYEHRQGKVEARHAYGFS